MDEIDLTEKELSQALEVKALMDNLLSDQDYQYHQKNDWFSSDRLELILQQLNISEKNTGFSDRRNELSSESVISRLEENVQ